MEYREYIKCYGSGGNPTLLGPAGQRTQLYWVLVAAELNAKRKEIQPTQPQMKKIIIT
jgi:hypothetical protein